MNNAKIIEKWYKALNFSPVYDAEFYKALAETVVEDIKIDEYDTEEKTGRKIFCPIYICARNCQYDINKREFLRKFCMTLCQI